MSIERYYNKLYQFRFNHAFYGDGETNDFTITPLGNSRNLIRTHELILKLQSTGFDLIYRKESEGSSDPFVSIDSDLTLLFGVQLNNTEILNVTDLPTKQDATDLYICSADYDETSLEWSTIQTRQPQFTEEYTYNTARITFKIEDADGNVVHEENQFGSQDPDDANSYHYAFSVQLNTQDMPGRYFLKTYRAGILEDQTEIFLLNRLAHPDLIGVFELTLTNAIDYSVVMPYEAVLNIDAASTDWYYHIELTRDFTGGEFNIIDTTDLEADPPLFKETTSLDDYKKGETVIFKSDSALKRTDAPRTNYKLVVESDTTDFSLDKLPNPSLQNLKSIIYLKI